MGGESDIGYVELSWFFSSLSQSDDAYSTECVQDRARPVPVCSQTLVKASSGEIVVEAHTRVHKYKLHEMWKVVFVQTDF